MTLSDLASIGSFISGVAVVVTLIFLLLQMRQSNLNQRALMQQMRSSRTIDTILRESDRYLSETIGLAIQNDANMDEPRIRSFLQAMEATMFNWEDSFIQNQAGTLEASNFESDKNAFRFFIAIPAFRVAWRMNRQFYGKGFRDLGDAIMRETKVSQPPPLKSTWQAMMAEELAAGS